LKRVFEEFDEDKSGAITVTELKTAVSEYSELDANGKKEEISEM
jgi:Ca2+-binding EF-hand superfamily protein